MKRVIYFTLFLLQTSILYSQESAYEDTYNYIIQTEKQHGNYSPKFLETIINFAMCYDDTIYHKHYSELSELLLKYNDEIRDTFGVHSIEYRNTMSCIFSYAIFGRHIDQAYYINYHAKCIDAILRLDKYLKYSENNYLEFVTQLSGVNRELGDFKKAIKYGRLKLNKSLKLYGIESKEYLYALSNLLYLCSENGAFREYNKLLKEFLAVETIDKSGFLQNIINTLPPNTPDTTYDILINEYRKAGYGLQEIQWFIMTAAKNGNRYVINLIESIILPASTSKEDNHDFYSMVGLSFSDSKIAIEYLQKAITYAEANGDDYLNYIKIGEGQFIHLWDGLAQTYSNMNKYKEAAYAGLNTVRFFNKYGLSNTEELRRTVYYFIEHYKAFYGTDSYSIDDLREFIHDYNSVSGTLNELSNLSFIIRLNNDIEGTNVIDEIIAQQSCDIETKFDFYFHAGSYCNNVGHYDEAIIMYKKSIECAQLAGRHDLLYETQTNRKQNLWLHVAFCQEMLGLYDDMIESKKIALNEIGKDLGRESSEYLDCITNIATSYSYYFSDVEKAIEYDLIALEVSKETKNETHLPNIYLSLISQFYTLAKYDNALEYVEEAISVFENNAEMLSDLQNQLGKIFRKQGKWGKSELAYKKAIELTSNKKDEVQYLCNLSGLYEETSDITQIHTVLSEVERYLSNNKARNNTDSILFYSAYKTLATAYIYNPTKALKDITKAETYLNHDNPEAVFLHFQNKSIIELKNDERYAAWLSMQKAIKIYKDRLNNPILYGNIIKDLGDYYHTILDYDKAEIAYLEADNIYDKYLPLHSSQYIALLNNMAMNRKANGQITSAIFTLEIVKNVIKDKYGVMHPNYLTTTETLISFSLHNKEVEKAQMLLDEYCELTKDVKEMDYQFQKMYFNAYVSFLEKEYITAELTLSNALKLKINKNEKEKVNNLLIDIYRQTNSPKLIAAMKGKLDYWKTDIVNEFMFMTDNERHNTLFYLDNIRNELITTILVNQDITRYGADFILFSKGLLFNISATTTKLLANNSKANEDWQELIDTKIQLNQAITYGDSTLINNLNHQKESIERKLTNEFISIKEIKKRLDVSSADVLKRIGKDGIAVDFVRYLDNDTAKYGAFLMSTKLTVPVFVKICDESALESKIKSSSKDVNYKFYWSSLKRERDASSYRLIWNNLIPYFQEYDNIFFSGDGLLHQIAIEYLCDEDDIPICNKYKLHRVFHLANIGNSREIGDNFLAIGVSDHNAQQNDRVSLERGSWSNLEGVKNELSIISSKIEQPNSNIQVSFVTNNEASEDYFKSLDQSPITTLHIATHGFFKDRNSLNDAANNPNSIDYNMAQRVLRAGKENLSGLILNYGNQLWNSPLIEQANDGVLTSDEIECLTFPNLQLTILSACETGLGNINSEGVWGLQRSFRIAGTQLLICSLCKIDDEWTSRFMEVFYEQLTQGMTIYESFHAARSHLFKKKKSNPKIWSSMILIE